MDEILDSKNREIRVASLFPKSHERLSSPSSSSPSDPLIQISLQKVSLNDSPPPKYTALSYVWGDPEDTITILVDGVEFRATKNLVSALRELQHGTEIVTLWVDAICIRQSDNDEKPGQIQLMKQIYEASDTVVVWLGNDADGSGEIMKMIAEFSARPDFRDAISDDLTYDVAVPNEFGTTATPFVAEAEIICKLMLLDPSIPTDSSHPAFLSTRYPCRLIVNTVIACGRSGYRVNVDLFDRIVHYYVTMIGILGVSEGESQTMLDEIGEVPRHKLATLAIGLYSSGAYRMLTQRRKYRRGQGADDSVGHLLIDHLFDAYTSFYMKASLRSTDPRDLIYGLLSLADDVRELGIVPDYTKSYQEVFCGTWSAILRRYGDVNLLSWAIPGEDLPLFTNITDHSLPSWVPDWRQSRRFNRLYWKDFFLACGHMRQDTQWVPDTNTGQNPRTLTLKGVRIDTVVEVGTALSAYDPFRTINTGPFLRELGVLLEEINQYLQKSSSISPSIYPTTTALAEAKWRIPVCDLESSPEHGNEFTFNTRYLVGGPQQWNRATSASEEGFQALIAVLEFIEESYMCTELSVALTERMNQVRMTMARHSRVFYDYVLEAQMLPYRRPFMTAKGWVGRGPAGMIPGDVVVIFWGCRMPFVLRPCGDGDQVKYRLVGEAYVHGLMDGEVVRAGVEKEEKVFDII